MPDDQTDADTSDLARDVLAELDPGTVVGDRVILSKRQAALVLTGGATLAGVLGLTAGNAAGQASGGTLGTDSDPIDADLSNFGSESTASGYEITIEGDTYQLNE